MPIYEGQCEQCGAVAEILCVRHCDEVRANLANGEYVCGDCGGTLRRRIETPNVYSHAGAYPFVIPPWTLPPKNGRIQHVEVQNRADLIRVLKEHGMSEAESEADKLTMYERGPQTDLVTNEDIAGDMKTYHKMLRSPQLRRKVIKDALQLR